MTISGNTANRTVTFSTPGSYSLVANCSDGAGNYNDTSVTVVTIVDVTNPSIFYNPSTTSAGNHSQNWIFINITASDSNIDTVLLEWNGTNESFDNSSGNIYWENKTGLSDGTYTIKAFVNDTAGNSNSTETRTIFLDTTPPTTTDNAPAGWQSTPFNVTLTCNDTGSGCSVTSYRVDGGSWQTGTIVEITTDGNHTIQYNSTDALGNIESTKTTYAALDTASPTYIWINKSTSGTTGDPVEVKINASDNTSGVSEANITIDGTTHAMDTSATDSDFNYTISVPSNSIDNITYNVTIYDLAGNLNITETVTIVVTDNDVPSVSTIQPTSGNEDTPINFNATVSDNIGVTSSTSTTH